MSNSVTAHYSYRSRYFWGYCPDAHLAVLPPLLEADNLKFEGENLKYRAFQSTKKPVAKQLVAPWSCVLENQDSC